MRRVSVLTVLCLILTVGMFAQDAVPGEILARTRLIKNNAIDKSGTGFLDPEDAIATVHFDALLSEWIWSTIYANLER